MRLLRIAAPGLERPDGIDVNDHPAHRGTTATMAFDITARIQYVSQSITLQSGELIRTGTAPGIGMRLGITGLGEQRQRVIPVPANAAS